MILIDTGPLVALFDRRQKYYEATVAATRSLSAPLATTVPVLTEALHLLRPGSRAQAALREFVRQGGVRILFLSEATLGRALDLMEEYEDHPMDLGDASLVASAEAQRLRTVFTLDRRDFEAYRVRFGKTLRAFQIIDPA